MNKSFIKIYLLSIFSLMALVSISCGNKTTASKGLEHYAGTWTMTGDMGEGYLTIGTDGSIEMPGVEKFTKDKIKDNGGDEYEFSVEENGYKTTIKFKFTSDTEGTVTMIVSVDGQSKEGKGTLKKK